MWPRLGQRLLLIRREQREGKKGKVEVKDRKEEEKEGTESRWKLDAGGGLMKGPHGGRGSKPNHSYLGKEGFDLHGRDGGKEAGGGGEMKSTGEALRRGGWGRGGEGAAGLVWSLQNPLVGGLPWSPSRKGGGPRKILLCRHG